MRVFSAGAIAYEFEPVVGKELVMKRVCSQLRSTFSVLSPFAAAFATIGLVTMGFVPTSFLQAAERQPIRAAAVAVDITPTRFPVSSNGSMRDRQAIAAHDPLHARCLVLDNGEARVAIVVCDSCAIPREIFDNAKQHAEAKTGIPVSHMLMSATHTHSAVTVTAVFQSEPELAYQEFVTERIASAVSQACQSLEPARVGWATAEESSQVFNRRWHMKPGFEYIDPFGLGTDRVRMNPPRGSDLLDRAAGPIDPTISLVSVETRSGQPLCVLANYSLHYVGGVPAELLSADYFGEFARWFAQRVDAGHRTTPFVAIMSNGTSGNINNVDFAQQTQPRRPFEKMRQVAIQVSDAAYQAYQSIEYHDWIPLKMAEAELSLGVRVPSGAEVSAARQLLASAGPPPYQDRRHIYARETILLADYPRQVTVKLQSIRLGEVGIVSTPCETFVETGLAIRRGSPLPLTFTIELANGYNGYLPTPEHHALGGYETWRARSSYLAVDAEPAIRRKLLELLNEVAQ